MADDCSTGYALTSMTYSRATCAQQPTEPEDKLLIKRLTNPSDNPSAFAVSLPMHGRGVSVATC